MTGQRPGRPLRIAYFAHLNDGRGSGVTSKVAGQLAYWRATGHTATLFLATSDIDESWHPQLGDLRVRRYVGVLSRLNAITSLVRAIRAFRPDVVYLRMDMFYPPMLWFPPRVPLVAEVNTDDVAEYALGSPIRARYNAMTRGITLSRAAAMVFVTSELSQSAAFRSFRGRHEVISNGIDLATYPSLPAPSDDRPRLAFVGTADQPWQGVDKVQTLARLRPDWTFDVVGSSHPVGATGNIRWHGALERDGVLSVLARADVGIGPLALHRKALDEACPLKIREYLAVGLPVIYGHRDPDADQLGPLSLRIPNVETNIEESIDRIDAFVEESRGVRVPREIIAHLDTGRKEEQRLALFGDLAHD